MLLDVAQFSPRVEVEKIRREITISGGDLSFSELGKEVCVEELVRIEKLLRAKGGNDEDIRNFHRKLGLKP